MSIFVLVSVLQLNVFYAHHTHLLAEVNTLIDSLCVLCRYNSTFI